METRTLEKLLNLSKNKERRMYNTLYSLFSKIERTNTQEGRMRLEKLIPIALTSGENIIIQFNNKRVGVCFEQKSGIILKGEQKDLEELISIVLNKTMSHQEFSMN